MWCCELSTLEWSCTKDCWKTNPCNYHKLMSGCRQGLRRIGVVGFGLLGGGVLDAAMAPGGRRLVLRGVSSIALERYRGDVGGGAFVVLGGLEVVPASGGAWWCCVSVGGGSPSGCSCLFCRGLRCSAGSFRSLKRSFVEWMGGMSYSVLTSSRNLWVLCSSRML